jgi:cell division protease FtsH
MIDFEEAKDKVMMGMERKSMIISEDEKKITAYHEIGHVLVARMLPDADPVHKVTIIPRGRALGVTSYLPIDEKHTYSKEYLESIITYALGGRAAEKIVFNHYTTGAGNDIEKATGIARKMVCEWGMSDKLGPLSYGAKKEEIFLGREIQSHRDYSEKTAIEIDEEVRRIIGESMVRSEKILRDNIDLLHKLSLELLEREILDGSEIDQIAKGEELPPMKKNGNAEHGESGEMPEHVKKLLDQRKPKESASKDESN